MTADPFTAVPGTELHPLIGDVPMPATTADLVAAARSRGGSERAIETLTRLPARSWDRIDEVVAAATSGWEAEPG